MDAVLILLQIGFAAMAVFTALGFVTSSLPSFAVAALIYGFSAYYSWLDDSFIPLVIGGGLLYLMRKFGFEPTEKEASQAAYSNFRPHNEESQSIRAQKPAHSTQEITKLNTAPDGNELFAYAILSSIEFKLDSVDDGIKYYRLDLAKFLEEVVRSLNNLGLKGTTEGGLLLAELGATTFCLRIRETDDLYEIATGFRKALHENDRKTARAKIKIFLEYLSKKAFCNPNDQFVIRNHSVPDKTIDEQIRIASYLLQQEAKQKAPISMAAPKKEQLAEHNGIRHTKPPSKSVNSDLCTCPRCGHKFNAGAHNFARCENCSQLVNITTNLVATEVDRRQREGMAATNNKKMDLPKQSNQETTGHEIGRKPTRPWRLNKATGTLHNEDRKITFTKSQYVFTGSSGIKGYEIRGHPQICWINDWDVEKEN